MGALSICVFYLILVVSIFATSLLGHLIINKYHTNKAKDNIYSIIITTCAKEYNLSIPTIENFINYSIKKGFETVAIISAIGAVIGIVQTVLYLIF